MAYCEGSASTGGLGLPRPGWLVHGSLHLEGRLAEVVVTHEVNPNAATPVK